MKHEKLKERSPMTDNAEKPFEVDAKADDIKQASSFMELPILDGLECILGNCDGVIAATAGV